MGYDERQRAIDCLAAEVCVEGDDPDDLYIDDSEYMGNLAEEIEECALKQRAEELKNG